MSTKNLGKRILTLFMMLTMLVTYMPAETFADIELQAKSKTVPVVIAKAKASSKSVKISWLKTEKAYKYSIFGGRCGKSIKLYKKNYTKNSITIKKMQGKRLKNHSHYKFYVVAYNKSGNKIAKSIAMHVIAGNTNKKYGNAQAIRTDKTDLTLKIMEEEKISPYLTAYNGKKNIPSSHVATYRSTSNVPSVVKVIDNDRIQAISAGEATVYTQAANGLYCTTHVVVEDEEATAEAAPADNGGHIDSNPEYAVHFETNGHGEDIPVQTVKAGSKIVEPIPKPKELGMIFYGWYKDKSLTEKWNFSQDTVNSFITLYACWLDDDLDVAKKKAIELIETVAGDEDKRSDAVQELVDKYTEDINNATDKPEVEKLTTEGIAAIQEQQKEENNPLESDKERAKAALEAAAGNPDGRSDEVQRLVENGKKEIDRQTTSQDVYNKEIEYLAKIAAAAAKDASNKAAREAAVAAVEKAAGDKDSRSDELQKIVDEAKENIREADTPNDISNAANDGIEKISEQIKKEELDNAKESAKDTIDLIAGDKDNRSDEMQKIVESADAAIASAESTSKVQEELNKYIEEIQRQKEAEKEADPYADYRKFAEDAIESAAGDKDTRSEEMQKIVDSADAAIASADGEQGIKDAMNEYLDEIAKQIANEAADPVAVSKQSALAAIETAAGDPETRSDEMKVIVESARNAINGSDNVDSVTGAMKEGLEEIAKQLQKEKLDEARKSAVEALQAAAGEGYESNENLKELVEKGSEIINDEHKTATIEAVNETLVEYLDYISKQKEADNQSLKDAIERAKAAIESAAYEVSSDASVQNIVNDASTALDNCKTNDEVSKELQDALKKIIEQINTIKGLDKTKEAAIKAIEESAGEEAGRSDEMQHIVDNAKKDISADADKDEVLKDLENYLKSIDEQRAKEELAAEKENAKNTLESAAGDSETRSEEMQDILNRGEHEIDRDSTDTSEEIQNIVNEYIRLINEQKEKEGNSLDAEKEAAKETLNRVAGDNPSKEIKDIVDAAEKLIDDAETSPDIQKALNDALVEIIKIQAREASADGADLAKVKEQAIETIHAAAGEEPYSQDMQDILTAGEKVINNQTTPETVVEKLESILDAIAEQRKNDDLDKQKERAIEITKDAAGSDESEGMKEILKDAETAIMAAEDSENVDNALADALKDIEEYKNQNTDDLTKEKDRAIAAIEAAAGDKDKRDEGLSKIVASAEAAILSAESPENVQIEQNTGIQRIIEYISTHSGAGESTDNLEALKQAAKAALTAAAGDDPSDEMQEILDRGLDAIDRSTSDLILEARLDEYLKEIAKQHEFEKLAEQKEIAKSAIESAAGDEVTRSTAMQDLVDEAKDAIDAQRTFDDVVKTENEYLEKIANQKEIDDELNSIRENAKSILDDVAGENQSRDMKKIVDEAKKLIDTYEDEDEINQALYDGIYNIVEQKDTETDLDAAKESGKIAIDDVLGDSPSAALQELRKQARKEIDEAQDDPESGIKGVDRVVDILRIYFENIEKQKAEDERLAKELDESKLDAIAAIEELAGPVNERSAEMQKLVDDYTQLIKEAETVEEVATTETNAKKNIEKQQTREKVIVQFDNNGHGEAIPAQEFGREGGKVTEPPTPSAEGYLFDGWYTTPGCGAFSKFDFDKEVVRTDMILYAKWIAGVYTVHFDRNGGDLVNPVTSADVPPMTDQVIPFGKYERLFNNKYTKNGWKFVGWSTTSGEGQEVVYLDGASVIDICPAGTDEITLYAQWQPEDKVALFYSSNNTTMGTVSPIVEYVARDGEASGSCAHANPGYKFKYWISVDNDDIVCTAEAFKPQPNPETDLYETAQYQAIFEPINYKIRFNKNAYITVSGEATADPTVDGEMADMDMTYGVIKKLTPIGFDRPNWSFIKWTTSADGSGLSFGNGESVSNLTTSDNAIVNLYAQWEQGMVTVTFDTRKDDISVKSQKIPSGTTATRPEPKKTGYTFLDWYESPTVKLDKTNCSEDATGNAKMLSSDGETEVDATPFDFSTEITENKTLYGLWKNNTYKVVFHLNDGTDGDTKRTQIMTYDVSEKLDLKPTDWKIENKSFKYWSEDKDGTTGKKYADGESVTNLRSDDHATIDLYAIWDQDQYTVEFDNRGHGNYIPDEKVDSGTLLTGTKYVLSADGYKFGGWWKDPGFKVEWDFNTDKVKSNLTLYCKWTPNHYRVKFDTNTPDASGSVPEIDMIYDKSALLPTVSTTHAISLNGYKFAGWAEVSGEPFSTSLVKYGDGTSVLNLCEKPNDDWGNNPSIVTLYAIWAEGDAVTISYLVSDAEKGSVVRASELVTPDGEAVGCTAIPKEGYKFDEWRDNNGNPVGNAELDVSDNKILKPIKKSGNPPMYEDTVYTAVFSGQEYTIRYHGGSNDTIGSVASEDAQASAGATYYDQKMTVGVRENLLANKFELENWQFAGWTTSSAESAKKIYDDKESVINLAETETVVDLYAMWTKVTYKVEFDVQQHGLSVDPQTIWSGGKANEPTPTEDGYTLEGWYTRPDPSAAATATLPAARKWTFSSDAVKDNMTLYANWLPNKYIVKYDGNGADASCNPMSDDAFTYDEQATLAKNTYYKTGYTFGGWIYDDSIFGRDTLYADQQNVINLSKGTDPRTAKNTWQTVTLKANWVSKNDTTIYYETDDLRTGFVKPTVEIAHTTADAQGSTAIPTKPGYKCDYWTNSAGDIVWSSADASGTSSASTPWLFDRSNFNPVKLNNGQVSENATNIYTAHWTGVDYRIKYDPNDGTGSESYSWAQYDVSQLTQDPETLGFGAPASTPDKVFAGWNTEQDGTGVGYKKLSEIKNLTTLDDEVVTLYAQWHYPTGGRIFYVRDSKDGSTYTFYDQTGKKIEKIDQTVENLKNAMYYEVEGVAKIDKFYVLATQGGDPSANAVVSGQLKWSNTQTEWGNNSSEIGSGKTNTSIGLAKNVSDTGTIWAALKTQNESKLNGLQDWFIGSYDEANLADDNIRNIVKENTLQSKTLWTSTETNYQNAWLIAGFPPNALKTLNYYTVFIRTLGGEAKRTYNVLFKANDGEGDMDPQTVISGESVTLNANSFNPPKASAGKVFVGWNTKKDGTGDFYKDGALIPSLGDNLVLYAQWHYPTGGKIVYDASADGTLSAQDKAVNYTLYDKEGKVVTGWETDSNKLDKVMYYEATGIDQGRFMVRATVSGDPEKAAIDINDIEWGATGVATGLRISDENPINDTKDTGVVGSSKAVCDRALNTELYSTVSKDSAGGSNTIWSWLKKQRDDSLNYCDDWCIPSPLEYYRMFGEEEKDYWTCSEWVNGTTASTHYFGYASSGKSRDSQIKTTAVRMMNTSGSLAICTLRYKSNNNDGDVITEKETTNSIIIIKAIDSTAFRAPDGKKFIGWNTKVDGTGTPYYAGQRVKIEGNMILYAQWGERTYRVEFDLNGLGDYQSSIDDQDVGENCYASKPADPVATGYKFAGWYKDSNCEDVWNFSSDKVNKNLTLFAKWVSNGYKIKFEPNYEYLLPPMDEQIIAYGYPTKLYKNEYLEPSTEVVFVGWNTKKDGTGDFYEDQEEVLNLVPGYKLGDEEMPEITLYAQWHFPVGGRIFYVDSSKDDGAVYTFYDEQGKRIIGDYDDYRDLEYAEYYEIKGDPKFDKYFVYATDDKDNAITKKNIQWGAAATLLGLSSDANKAIGGGKLNSKIALSADSLAHTLSSSTTTNVEAGNESGNEMTAWKYIKDARTDVLNDCDDWYLGSEKEYLELQKTKLTKDVMTAGINLYSSTETSKSSVLTFSGTDQAAAQAFKTSTSGMVIPIRSFGRGTKTEPLDPANYKTITFLANGGSGTMNPQLVKKNESTALNANTFKAPKGMTFAGWNTNASGDGIGYSNGQEITTNEDMTLYAQWVGAYEVEFDLNGHQAYGQAIDDQIVAVGGKATKPASAEAKGYTFGGWYKEAACVNPWNFDDNITKDTTLYAKWTARTYKIRFDRGTGNLTQDDEGHTLIQDMVDLNMTYDQAKTLTSNTYMKTGCAFAGWKVTSCDGVAVPNGAVYADMSNVINLCDNPKADGSSVVTLTAEWAENGKVTIFYRSEDVNRGTVKPEAEILSETANATGATASANAGYHFTKWTETDGTELEADDATVTTPLDNTKSTIVPKKKDNVNVSAIYTAHFEANKYKVVFKGGTIDGYSGTVTGGATTYNQTLTYDKLADLDANKFAITGYTFTGWKVTKEYGTAVTDGKTYADEKTVLNLLANPKTDGSSEIELTAQWTINKFTVDFDMNGHGKSMKPVTAKYNQTVKDALAAAERDSLIDENKANEPAATGYTFKGWYTDQDCTAGKEWSTANKGVTEDVTLYAKWEAREYTIHYDSDDADSGTMADSTDIKYDQKFNLPENQYVKHGYTFGGWWYTGNGTSLLADRSSVINLCTNPDENELNNYVTIYPNWIKDDKVVIFYKADDIRHGKVSPEAESVDIIGTADGSTATANYGYSFDKWTNMEGDDVSGVQATVTTSDDKKTSTIKPLKISNVNVANTYTAHFKANKYLVKFLGGSGAEGSMNNQTLTYDKVANLDENKFTKTGYTFAGWKVTAKDATVVTDGETYDNKETVLNLVAQPVAAETSSITLTAQWTINKFTVDFDMNGHGKSIKSVSAEYNQKVSDALSTAGRDTTIDVSEAKAPTETGYTFGGWYTDQACSSGKKWTIASSTVTADTTLYAKWTANKYSIVYYRNQSNTDNTTAEQTGFLYDQVKALDGYGVADKTTESFSPAAGYRFAGWNTARNGQGTSYADMQEVINLNAGVSQSTATIPDTAKVKLYAQYTEIDNVVIQYMTNNPTMGTVYLGHEAINPESTTPPAGSYPIANNGYHFVNWTYTKGVVVTNISGQEGWVSTVSDHENTLVPGKEGSPAKYLERTYVANFAPDEYTISFGSDGESITAKYGETTQLSDCKTTKTGYTFSGWKLTKVGNATTGHTEIGTDYTENADVTALVKSKKANLTFAAVWTAETHTVYFDAQGGVCATSKMTGKYNDSPFNPSETVTATKTGYAFGGWSTTEGGTTKVTSINYTEDTILYAIWTPNKYQIVYAAGKDSRGKAATKKQGVAATEYAQNADYDTPVTLKKGEDLYDAPAGSKFKGWLADSTNGDSAMYIGGQHAINVYKAPTSGTATQSKVTLTAQWEDETKTIITFMTEDIRKGTVSRAFTDHIKHETSTATAKAGYKFDKWTTSANDTALGGNWIDSDGVTLKPQVNAEGVYDPVTYVAHFVGRQYKITFNSNYGTTAATKEQTLNYGEVENLTVNTFTRAGYTFQGWSESTNGTIMYTDGAAVKNLIASAPTEDGKTGKTLYAIWKANDCEVEFDLNGKGDGGIYKDVTVIYGNKVDKPADPKVTGYTFKGWYKEKTVATAWNFASDTVTADMTLYAKWTANTYTISYAANGGGGTTMSSTSATYDQDATLTACGYTAPAGKQFAYWTDANGARYWDKQTVRNLTATASGTVALTAQWEDLDNVAIKYISNDLKMGTVNPGIELVKPSGTATGSTAKANAGYKLVKWTKENNTTSLSTAATYTPSKESSVYKTATYVANFVGRPYKITFNSNYGTPTTKEQTLNYGEVQNLDVNTFTRTGYTFMGWAESDSATVVKYTDGTAVKNLIASAPTADDASGKTLYAVWKAADCEVEFNLNGHCGGGSYMDKVVAYGDKVTKPTDPVDTGYKFDGWYKETTCTNAWNFSTAVTSNTTLYAKWTPITYTIAYNLDGGSGSAPSSQTGCKYGTSYKLADTTTAKTGYTFLGWQLRTGANTQQSPYVYGDIYQPNSTVKNLTATDGTTVTMVAKWVSNNDITVFYKSEDTEKGTVDIEYQHGAAASWSTDITGSTATPEPGYKLDGWYLDGSATRLSTDEKYVPSDKKSAVYVAKFVGKTAKVYLRGGEVEGQKIINNKVYGETYTPQTSDYSSAFSAPTGKVLVGWNNTSNGKFYKAGDPVDIEATTPGTNTSVNIYLEAVWHYPVGGRIFFADDVSYNNEITFYDEDNNQTTMLNHAMYYEFSSVPPADKYYVVATDEGKPDGDLQYLGTSKWNDNNTGYPDWARYSEIGEGRNITRDAVNYIAGQSGRIWYKIKDANTNKLNGLNDWFIGSSNEMSKLIPTGLVTGVQGLWTATEVSDSQANILNTNEATQNISTVAKTTDGAYDVLPIRTLSFPKEGSNVYRITYRANLRSEYYTGRMEPQLVEVQQSGASRNVTLNANKFAYKGTKYVFAGWNTTPSGSGAGNVHYDDCDSVNVTKDLTLYASWEVASTTYKVEHWLESEGVAGTPTTDDYELFKYDDVNANVGTEISFDTLAAPTEWPSVLRSIKRDITGYNLHTRAQFSDNRNMYDKLEVQPDGKTVIKLYYDRVKANISFDKSGAVIAESNVPNDTALKYGSKFDLFDYYLTDANGERNVGWKAIWTKPDGSSERISVTDYVLTAPAGGTVVVSGTWNSTRYTVRYDSNGGEGSMDDSSFSVGVRSALRANEFTAPTDTEEFAGWNTKANGTGTAYKDKEQVLTLANAGQTITLYAQWATKQTTPQVEWQIQHYTKDVGADTYSIKEIEEFTGDVGTRLVFDATESLNGFLYTYKKSYTGFKLEQSTKNLGDYTLTEGKTTIIKLYYEREKYNVTFDTDGAQSSWSTYGRTCEYGAEFDTSDIYATNKAGEKNILWKVNASSYPYSRIAVIFLDDTFTMPACDVTLRPVWSGEYTVKYDANGGSDSMTDSTFAVDKRVTLKKCTFTPPEGKDFVGWNTKADGTGTNYKDEEKVYALVNAGETITLYAQWAKVVARKEAIINIAGVKNSGGVALEKFRVLNILDNNVAEVVAMSGVNVNPNASTETVPNNAGYFQSHDTAKYAESQMDEYLNVTYYGGLPDEVRTAIIPQPRVQYVCEPLSWQPGGATLWEYERLSQSKGYVAHDDSYALPVGNRYVYALNTQDIFKYVGEENVTANDIQKMLCDKTGQITGLEIFLCDGFYNRGDFVIWSAANAEFSAGPKNSDFPQTRAAFTIDLNKVEWSYVD